MSKDKLTHIDQEGKAQMVDIGGKPDSIRTATARGEIRLSLDTLNLIKKGSMKKGDVFAVAQIAGIMAAKRTSEWIPLCHPIPLTHIHVEIVIDEDIPGVVITSSVKSGGKTGVEMEALTAVSAAALTIYDMVKAVEKAGTINNIRLIEKHGGMSGDFKREE